MLEPRSGFRLFRLAAASSLIETFSCMSCTSMVLATVFYFPAPRRGHRRSPGQQRRRLRARCHSGTGSRRLRRRQGVRYRQRRGNPMLAPINQQKAYNDIYYRGVVVRPASQYAQGTGPGSISKPCNFLFSERSMDSDMKEYTRIWRIWSDIMIGCAGRRGWGSAWWAGHGYLSQICIMDK